MIRAKDIKKIAVIGSGIIGNSWTANYVWKGYPVNLWCYEDEEIKVAKNDIQEHLESLAENGIFNIEEIPKMMSLIKYTKSIEEAVKDSELIQESILENLELKQKLLVDVDKYANNEAIFASSTSYLTITDICKNSQYSRRCINTHPFNPPHLIPLVEITFPEGELGSKETAEVAAEFYKSLGKVPIILKKDVSGFVGNQIQGALNAKCRELVAQGVCTLDDIDKAVSFGPGLRWATMGPNLVFQLGSKGGIKGMRMHFMPIDIREGDEKIRYEYIRLADLLQAEVNEIIAKRDPELGNDTNGLRKFRDRMIIEMLKLHKKI